MGYNLVCDIEATGKYRDIYNDQCHCDMCKNFRLSFMSHYPRIITFLEQFGLNVYYLLEIMDLGLDDEKFKRKYSVYYSVKGEFPVDKIQLVISEANIVIRNWNIAGESYSNTGMEKPYFIIEITDLFIKVC